MSYAYASPVIVRITESDTDALVGYFTGLTIRKFGLKLLGSPFEGWSTCYMAYDVYDQSLIKDLLAPTIRFIFQKTGCVYLELVERNLTTDDFGYIDGKLRKMGGFNYKLDTVPSLEVDIAKPDAELIRAIRKDCREFIRQFERRGASVEIAEPTAEFVEELYAQIREVFAKQNLVPPYSIEKIRLLLENLQGSGMLLCLVIREPQGKNIASIVFAGRSQKCFAFFTGSHRDFQHFRPNEYMVWYGIRYFRDRGYTVFDYAGVAAYKYKWNPREVYYVRIMASRYPGLICLRNKAKDIFRFLMKVRGFGKGKKVPDTQRLNQGEA
jgi:hypothetical protein